MFYTFLYKIIISKIFVFFLSLPFVTLVGSFRTRETLNGKISKKLQKQIDSYLAIATYEM